MDEKFGWALIGCGAIANIVAKQLSAYCKMWVIIFTGVERG